MKGSDVMTWQAKGKISLVSKEMLKVMDRMKNISI